MRPSNRRRRARDEILSAGVTTAAMRDSFVHPAEFLAPKGDSYRLKDHDLVQPAPVES